MSLSLCLCISGYRCIPAHVEARGYTWVSSLGIPPTSFETGPLTNPELANWAILAGCWAGKSACLLLPALKLQVCPDTQHLFIYLLILVCMGIWPACLSAYHVCAVPTETSWESEILWNWNYRCLEAAIWVLEIEFRFSRRAIDAVALKSVF